MAEIDEETNRQLDRWVTAKRNRDYVAADAIRAALESRGIKAEQKKSIQGFKETFGYVPPAIEQPWAASLTSNSGKIVQQEGNIVPVTGKAVDGAFRPPGMRVTGEKRTGEGGGFREFDDAEESRRKQRALEVKAETSARKAEKKKCDYCKRASCIC